MNLNLKILKYSSLEIKDLFNPDGVNLKISPSIELINEIKGEINWKEFCQSEYITANIIKSFPEYIKIGFLIKNYKFTWTSELLFKYKNNIEKATEPCLFFRSFKIQDQYTFVKEYVINNKISASLKDLCANPNFDFGEWIGGGNFNSPSIKEIYQNLDFRILSENINTTWNSFLLEKHKSEINWNTIVLNPSFHRNNYYIEKYQDYLVWGGHLNSKFQHRQHYETCNICNLKNIDLNVQILKKHSKNWYDGKRNLIPFDPWSEKDSGENEWYAYSKNNNLISLEIMKEFENYLFFDKISRNKDFNWTFEKLEFCKDKINLATLLSNDKSKIIIHSFLFNHMLKK